MREDHALEHPLRDRIGDDALEPVADLDARAPLLHRDDEQDPVVEAALAELRARSDRLTEARGTHKFEGKLIVQADESIPFHVLQKIMYTSQTVGFYDITLAVLQK